MATIARPQGQARAAAGLAMLLGVAIFINSVDRGNLATAAPVIKDEFHLSATQMGMLFSAFYWTYAISQLGAGWLAERFPVQRVIAAGFALWSIATILTGAATGFAMLLGFRLLLGLGESVAFPCSTKLLAVHVGTAGRGRANGAIGVGLAGGSAFGTFVGGLILARFGWRWLFVSLGALSLLWLWPWLAGPARQLERMPAAKSPPRPTFFEIAFSRGALSASLGHFCGNYALYFVLSWLPLYLVKERGFSITHMAALAGTVYLVQAVTALFSGRALDRFVRGGATTDRVYRTAMIVSKSTVAAGLVGAIWAPPLVSILCLFLTGIGLGMGTPALYAAAQTLAGPMAAGRWMGFENFVGNLAGIAGPWLTGILIDRTGHYYAAFALTIAIALVGVMTWVFLVPRIAQIDWTPDLTVPLKTVSAEA